MQTLHMKAALIACCALIIIAGCQRKGVAPAARQTTQENTAGPEKKALPEKSAPVSRDVAKAQVATQKASVLDYKLLYERGTQKHNTGDFQGAIKDFNLCIELNPDFAEAYNFRGLSRYKSGDKTGACDDWNKAAEMGLSVAQNMLVQYCR
ncbi:MAG: hypothetical protein KatS3mg031_0223 [Chitinophagales bacterium]|nr:MAG: hypothetical protein KatS3mg031_0223 [Chitinophagales bacterium]